MDPATCGTCHPKQYRDWEGSMHAYAAVDPVFLAMNQRGQRETANALGDFCVRCHAPMALREGLTDNGLNLAEVPNWAKGVTCYFCHNAVDVGPDHSNANVTLANDTTMRGSFSDAADPGVHGVAGSEFFNRNSMSSSLLCGTCHDVVNPKGVHLERTLAEYRDSVFSIEKFGKDGLSCQGCHMPFTELNYAASVSGIQLKKRDLHGHRWPAVDVALTDFPDREAFRQATECELASGSWILKIVNDEPGQFTVQVETNAGHNQPSGVAQDRRLWLEFVAYDEQNQILLESGTIKDGELEEFPAGHAQHDSSLCLFRDYYQDEAGHDVHMFWEVAKKSELSRSISPGKKMGDDHGARCRYRIPGLQEPARIEVRLRMRPVGLDVLQSLVDSGDLDPSVIPQMPTFTVHDTAVRWRPSADGNPEGVLENIESPLDCL